MKNFYLNIFESCQCLDFILWLHQFAGQMMHQTQIVVTFSNPLMGPMKPATSVCLSLSKNSNIKVSSYYLQTITHITLYYRRFLSGEVRFSKKCSDPLVKIWSKIKFRLFDLRLFSHGNDLKLKIEKSFHTSFFNPLSILHIIFFKKCII